MSHTAHPGHPLTSLTSRHSTVDIYASSIRYMICRCSVIAKMIISCTNFIPEPDPSCIAVTPNDLVLARLGIYQHVTGYNTSLFLLATASPNWHLPLEHRQNTLCGGRERESVCVRERGRSKKERKIGRANERERERGRERERKEKVRGH